jgi:RDD family protein
VPSSLRAPAEAAGDHVPAGSSPSPGRRLGAFAIDVAFIAVLMLLAMLFPVATELSPWEYAVRTALPYAPAAYVLFRDTIGGRSLGKLLVGLVVWDDRASRPAGFLDSVIRNAPFAVLLVPVGGPLVQGLLWPLYLIKLVAAMLSVTMLWQVLRRHPRRILEGPATTHVIDTRRR